MLDTIYKKIGMHREFRLVPRKAWWSLSPTINRIHFIDSHTGGEPTRLVTAGGPDLGCGSVSDRLKRFRTEFDWFRSAVANEPRGSDAMVGALLCEPADPTCV